MPLNLCSYNNIMEALRQDPERSDFSTGEILVDIKRVFDAKEQTDKDKEVPWREKKMRNENLADIYQYFDEAKSLRLRECGKFLDFRVYENGEKKLHSMTSCRVRLCPICAWRRSLKTFYNNLDIMKYLREEKGKNYQFIFLSLTIENCTGDKLSETIDEIFAGIHRMYERPEWKRAVKGACRCMEVTHNVKRDSKDFDTYHPHVHYLIAVNPSYFTSSAYLSHEKWQELWRSVMNLDYAPQVDIRKCYGTDANAVAECSKYSAKDTEYVIPDDWKLSVKTVKILDKALANRRLVGYTGVFRQARAALKLEDEENGSLINVRAEEALNEVLDQGYKIQTYCWYSGYKQYISVN